MIKADGLSLFPPEREFKRRVTIKEMKVLHKILFAFVLTAGMAVSASAQNSGQDRPPKDPPVVNPGTKPKPTPQPTPPKKPNYAFVMVDIGINRYTI